MSRPGYHHTHRPSSARTRDVGQRSRAEKRELKSAVRHDDPLAARSLLAHSVALRHRRLALRRFIAAHLLGVPSLEEHRAFCAAVARNYSADALLQASWSVAGELKAVGDPLRALAELLPQVTPFTMSYAGVTPTLSDLRCCGPDVSIVGDVELAGAAWLGPRSVLRADGERVRAGPGLVLGEGSTVHIAHRQHAAIIDDNVTIGRNGVVHACTIGNDCVIGDNVIVLDGAVIGEGVVVEQGSTVFPRARLAAGWCYAGSPAAPTHPVPEGDLERRRDGVRAALVLACLANHADPLEGRDRDAWPGVFVAPTASIGGQVSLGDNASVFFGSRLLGSDAGIALGPGTNIQDNVMIDATAAAVRVGARTTVGHNARLNACIVGARALIGIGSTVAAGTTIDDDVLLAAGAATEPGQHLGSGWLWAGRPARALKPLEAGHRAMMADTADHYRNLAAHYAGDRAADAGRQERKRQ